MDLIYKTLTSHLATWISIFSIITLFLFGLQSLSRELEPLILGPLKNGFLKITYSPVLGCLLGTGATALIQSSSAVTALAVSLVNIQVLTFQGILPILIGSNIGTASTAFLVTFKTGYLSSLLIVGGSIVGLMPWKFKSLGKSIFYFGFILFILKELNITLQEQLDPEMINAWLSSTQNQAWIYFYGLLAAALFQSSSLVTGLAVLLTEQNMLSIEQALYVVLGANVGTTSTALFVSLTMSPLARRAAISNLLFNLVGSLCVLPFVTQLSHLSLNLAQQNLGLGVAFSHLIFNCLLALLFLPLLYWLRARRSFL